MYLQVPPPPTDSSFFFSSPPVPPPLPLLLLLPFTPAAPPLCLRPLLPVSHLLAPTSSFTRPQLSPPPPAPTPHSVCPDYPLIYTGEQTVCAGTLY